MSLQFVGVKLLKLIFTSIVFKYKQNCSSIIILHSFQRPIPVLIKRGVLLYYGRFRYYSISTLAANVVQSNPAAIASLTFSNLFSVTTKLA